MLRTFQMPLVYKENDQVYHYTVVKDIDYDTYVFYYTECLADQNAYSYSVHFSANRIS